MTTSALIIFDDFVFVCFDISFHLLWYFFSAVLISFCTCFDMLDIPWAWLTHQSHRLQVNNFAYYFNLTFSLMFKFFILQKLFFWIIYVYFYGFMHHNSILVEICIFGVIYSSNWSPLPLFLCSWIFHLITGTLLIQVGQDCWPIINGCTKSKYELPWQKDK